MLQRLFHAQIIVKTCHGGKLAGKRPLRTDVDLFEFIVKIAAVVLQINRLVAAVFVAHAQGFARFGIVQQAGIQIFPAAAVFVVVHDGMGADILADVAVTKSHPVGTVALITANAAVEQHVIGGEIVFLADTGAQAFSAGLRIQITSLQGCGQAVGRVDAVVTRIQILAEQLLIAEAVFRRIEVG